MTDVELLYVTTSNIKEAKQIGKILLQERLAACINIFEKMTSLYWWKGKIDTAQYYFVIGYTVESHKNAIIDCISEVSKEEVPGIVFFEIEDANTDFLNWIKENTE